MSERFLIADMHFSHAGMVKFVCDQGKPIRPWGRALAEGEVMAPQEIEERVSAMDEAMVENWNRVVGKSDKVEVLGDAVINRRALPIFERLNGRKRLRLGNHDIFTQKGLRDYTQHFEDISAYKVMVDEKVILSHIPIHRDSIKERWHGNFHGHLHGGRVMLRREVQGQIRRVPIPGTNPPRLSHPFHDWETVIDPLYFCVSVEHIDYTPIHFDVALAALVAQQEGADH